MSKRIFLGAILAVALGVGCFFAAHELWPDGGQAGTQPDIRLEWERIRLEEAAKPRFEGVVNGIRLYGPDVDAAVQRKDACSQASRDEVEHLTMTDVAGTAMDIVPTYLPAGAEEVDPMSPPVACKGTLASVERWWVIRDRGADFFISHRQGEQAIDTDASAGRVSPATVGAKRAVLIKPLTPEGYGQSAVIVAEEFGITIVSAFDLPLEETVKIAEGLIAQTEEAKQPTAAPPAAYSSPVPSPTAVAAQSASPTPSPVATQAGPSPPPNARYIPPSELWPAVDYTEDGWPIVADELIVKFRDGVSEEEKEAILSEVGAQSKDIYEYSDIRVVKVDPAQRDRILEELSSNENVGIVEPNPIAQPAISQ
jgi:hypothetical protein